MLPENEDNNTHSNISRRNSGYQYCRNVNIRVLRIIMMENSGRSKSVRTRTSNGGRVLFVSFRKGLKGSGLWGSDKL